MKEYKNWRFYLKKIREFKCHRLIFIGVLSAIIKVSMSFFVDKLINYFSKRQYYSFVWMSVALIVCSFVLAVLMKVKIEMQAKYQQKAEFSMSKMFIQNINKVRGEFVDMSGIGSWMTVLIDDIKDYASIFSTTIPEILIGSISFLAAMFFGLIKSPLLTIVILFISMMTVFITHYLSKRLEDIREKEQGMNEEIKQSLLEIISSLALLRISNAHNFGKELFQTNFQKYKRQHMKREKMAFFIAAVSMGMGFILTTSWIVSAFYLIQYDKLTIGDFLGFMLLDSYFNWIFFNLPTLYGELKIQIVSGERISSYYEKMYDYDSPIKPLIKWDNIELNNVSFNYNQYQGDVLKDLSLRIKNGDKLNIMGESGCGKSTLMKLLNGYYRLRTGSMHIDDNEVENMRQLSRYISFVPQNNIIFPGTIKDNICLGIKINSDELHQILSYTGLHEFVSTLNNGLETIIESGAKQNLSEGQIQRIGIARALIERTPIIILDEPTSALDHRNEQIVVKFLEETDKTILLVTHRQTSVPKSFRTLRLVNGKLI